MLLASISDVGEYDAVIEAIRGVSDEDGATNYRAVKNRLLELFSEKLPEKGSILEANVFNLDITNMESQYGLRWPAMTRIASRATTVAKTAIMQVTAGQAEYHRQIKHFQREANEGQRHFIQVTKRQLHDNGRSRRK
jgi:hypothetical protein